MAADTPRLSLYFLVELKGAEQELNIRYRLVEWWRVRVFRKAGDEGLTRVWYCMK